MMKNTNRRNKNWTLILIVLICTTFFFSCKQKQEEKTEDTELLTDLVTYRADITTLNRDFNQDRVVFGDVLLREEENILYINVSLTGLEPGVMHMQHLHGFEDGTDSKCADIYSDANDDRIVDVVEASEKSGITMIPFHDDPASLELKKETYPIADETGTITYEQAVNLDSLKNALRTKHGITDFDLTKFSYMLHGVSKDANIPKTAQSALDTPAYLTIPVSCGELVLEEPSY